MSCAEPLFFYWTTCSIVAPVLIKCCAVKAKRENQNKVDNGQIIAVRIACCHMQVHIVYMTLDFRIHFLVWILANKEFHFADSCRVTSAVKSATKGYCMYFHRQSYSIHNCLPCIVYRTNQTVVHTVTCLIFITALFATALFTTALLLLATAKHVLT